MALAQSVREQILDALLQLYRDADVNTYGAAFSKVELGPLSEPDNSKRYTIGIVPGTEKKGDLFPYKDATLPVNIEFRVTVNKGDPKPGILVEQLLTVVQTVFYDDPTLGGLLADSHETGNEIDLDSYSDKSGRGVVMFELRYRHKHDDVRSSDPTV